MPISTDQISNRAKLERAGTLHWFHWCIVLLSLLLTLFAWRYSKRQLAEKVAAQFEREAEHIVELVLERMRKYEDALWAGVAYLRAERGDVMFNDWQQYARSISIEQKYPGINGLGVIHALQPEQLDEYLRVQRESRPGFRLHPEHSEHEYLPISYIVPVESNQQAVGLDMAHEENRYTAAKNCRDTGTAQITGPIVLVQDADQNPGFLFYAPFYTDDLPTSVAQRREEFRGMVYAPFVMNKLTRGTLEKARRHVGIRITDEDHVLYDEHINTDSDYDPNPLFDKVVNVPLYGRTWTFDIRSDRSFRDAAASSEPLTILLGGLFIDGMLIALFALLSRGSRQALAYADAMTHEIAVQKDELARANEALTQSNEELRQFAYIASHDLQTPLRAIAGFAQLLKRKYYGQLDETADDYVSRMVSASQRMQQLIVDLLNYSRVDSRSIPFEPTDLEQVFNEAVDLLAASIDDTGGRVTHDELPMVRGDKSQLCQLLMNLISNGLKYNRAASPHVHVAAELRDGQHLVRVSDNGIGIDEEHFGKIFEIFGRLHRTAEYPGTGVGLAVCRRIVQRHGGEIRVESPEGQGTTFLFTLPVAQVSKQSMAEPASAVDADVLTSADTF